MTRRICAMEHNGQFYVSQEFNGDYSEQLRFKLCTMCLGDWPDLISTFDGCRTVEEFTSAVRNMENAFHYQQEPLGVLSSLPPYEEVWLLQDGKLTLYSEYGELAHQ